MGIFSQMFGNLGGFNGDEDAAWEGSDYIDYRKGNDAAAALGDGVNCFHIGAARDHVVVSVEGNIEDFGPVDIAELGTACGAKNPEAFADGFANQENYDNASRPLRGLFNFFQNHNL